MPDLPTAKPTEPTRTELRMRSTAYNWFARHQLKILQGDVDDLVHRLAAIACPEERPVDREQPRVPRGATERAAAIRALTPEPAPKPAKAPPPPRPVAAASGRLDAQALATLRLIAQDDAPNSLIAHRLGVSVHRVKYLVGRLKEVLGEPERSRLGRAGDRAGLLGETLPVAILGPVRPSAALKPPDRGPGGSGAPEGRRGPSEAVAVASGPVAASGAALAAPEGVPGSTETSGAPSAPQTPVQGPGQVQP